MVLKDLLADLSVKRNEEQEQAMSAYMRHQFPFLGIRTPERSSLEKVYFQEAKKTAELDWDFVQVCYDKPEREYQYVAIDYLNYMRRFLTYDDLPRLKELIVTKSWWDTVDNLAKLVGRLDCSTQELSNDMRLLAVSDNIWLRRTAILHQLARKEKTDTELLAAILDANQEAQDFFIRKAMGWALRDFSKTDSDWVRNYVEKRRKVLSGLTIREASKYL